MRVKISDYDEQRLRLLAVGLAQQIREPQEILDELGFSEDDWRELEQSRVFKQILTQALAEWNNTARTPQRVKLKAAINIEQSLPQFYEDMTDKTQPLVARVRALEVVAKLAGIPEPELERPSGPQNQFKLEIHLGGGQTISVGSVSGNAAIPVTPGVTEVIESRESFKLPDFIFQTTSED